MTISFLHDDPNEPGSRINLVPFEGHVDMTILLKETLAFQLVSSITAAPGRGKTLAIETVRKNLIQAGHQVVVVDLVGSTKPRALMSEIHEQVTGQEIDPNVKELHLRRELEASLAETGPRLIVIDEAQNLTDAALKEFRKLFDSRRTEIGICIVGLPTSKKRPDEFINSRNHSALTVKGLSANEAANKLPDLHPELAKISTPELKRISKENAKGQIRYFVKLAHRLVVNGSNLPEALEYTPVVK